MRVKLLNPSGQRTWVLVFDPGEEPVSLLTQFAGEQNVRGAQLNGIGSFSDVTLAYFDPAEKQYKPIPVREQVEIMSLLGNIATFEDKPKLHVHCVVGKRDGATLGGHLLEAHVRPTLEIFVTSYEQGLGRVLDPTTNLPLLEP